MVKIKSLCILFFVLFTGAFAIFPQSTPQTQEDPCKNLRFLALSGEAPSVSMTDVSNFPQCFNGKFIRLSGIYRIAFENSDLYDPTENGSAWISFSPFYSAIKRCSPPEVLKLLNRENGGTFGLTALGVLKTGGGFGHEGGWSNEFQVICVEEVKDFSKSGVLFEVQPPKVQKQIISWYAKRKN